MTKKRFIKLLMGYGIRRNDATDHARMARRMGWIYARYFEEIIKPVFEEEWTKPV